MSVYRCISSVWNRACQYAFCGMNWLHGKHPFLSTHCVLGPELGPGDTALNQRRSLPLGARCAGGQMHRDRHNHHHFNSSIITTIY